jgi:hypothetical protein
LLCTGRPAGDSMACKTTFISVPCDLEPTPFAVTSFACV